MVMLVVNKAVQGSHPEDTKAHQFLFLEPGWFWLCIMNLALTACENSSETKLESLIMM